MSQVRTKTKHKHYVLDEAKIKRAQKLLGARTETEAIESTLDEVVTECQRNRIAWRTHERFLKSSTEIRDVYGLLKNG